MHEGAPPQKSLLPQSPGSLVFAALIAANGCLAFGPLFVREADVGPIASASWRLILAAPMLAGLMWASGQRIAPKGTRLNGATWLVILAAGIFFAADLAAWHEGILRTRVANATLFGNVTSFLFPIYGFFVARSLPDRRQALAILLALAGAAILLGRSFELSPAHVVGDLLSMLAGLLYTFYLIAIDRLRTRLAAWPVLLLSTLAGIAPLIGFAAYAGETIWPQNWTPLILLALMSQVVGQGLLIYAIARASALIIGLALLTQPVTAAAIGWIAYDERLAAPELIGAGMIAAALVMVRRSG